MSIVNRAGVACSKCGQHTEINVYRSINVSEDPGLREKVKDGSLFVWECPHCGNRNLARYDTLYHDPDRKLMVWLIPDERISQAQMEAIVRHTKAMGGYTLRLVDDTGSLIEKILINEAGLDDTVLELCKFVLRQELASKHGETPENFASVPLHFFRMNGDSDSRVITFMYPYKGKMIDANIGYNVYSDCIGILQRNPHIKPEGGFCRIDASWLATFMA